MSLPQDSQAQNGPPKGALAIIFLIVFTDLLGFGIIIPLLPLFAVVYHASALDVGLLFTIFSACQFVAAPILGALSDRFGRRPVLVFSQLGSSLGYLLLGLVMSVHWNHPGLALLLLYVSRFIDGISGGNISTAQAYISDVTTTQNRARGMGVLGAAFGVGFAIGPALGALLSVHPALPGYFAAVLSFGAAIQTHFRLPESRVHRHSAASDWLHPRRFAPVLRRSRLVQLLLIAFISMIAFVMLESMVALFLGDPKTFHFRYWQVGLYYAYIGATIAIVQGGLIGRLNRRLGEWSLAITGPFLVALGMGLIGWAGFQPMLSILIIGGGLNALGRSLQTPTLYALISHSSEAREQGIVFGLNQGIGGIARIIGPLLAAIAFRIHVSGPFLLGTAIILVAGGWTMVLKMKAPRESGFPLPADASAAESV